MMHYFIRMEVVQPTGGIFVSQKKYVREILARFRMDNCNPAYTPTEVGLKLVKDTEGRVIDNLMDLWEA